MKKRIFGIMLTVFMLVAVNLGAVQAYKNGDIIGKTLYTDIVASINDYNISSHNYNGYTMIVAEDLRDYGFTVEWNPSARTLSIDRNTYVNKVTSTYVASAVSKSLIGKKSYDVLYTDIRTFVNGREVPSYNLGGITVINFEELYPYGKVKYDDSVRRLDLTVNDGLSFNSKSNTSSSKQPEITQKNNTGYRVETVLRATSEQCGGYNKFYPDTIQVDDSLYVLSEAKVHKINLLTGKSSVYADLENMEINYDLADDGEKWTCSSLDKKATLMYHPKKQCFIVTKVNLVVEDKFGENDSVSDKMIDVTNKTNFRFPESAHDRVKDGAVYVFNINGDLLNLRYQLRFPYPRYESIEIGSGRTITPVLVNPIYKNNAAYTEDSGNDIISLDAFNKENGGFSKKVVFDGATGGSMGMVDKNNFVIMNDTALFMVDVNNNIQKKISLDTIKESDGKTIFCDTHSTLWASSAGDVVFYDRDKNCFRRITNN